MRRLRTPLLLAIVAALTLAGCGVSGGDQAGTDGAGSSSDAAATTTEPAEMSEADQEIVDTIAATYRSLGFTDEEADCLARGIYALGPDAADELDPTGAMDVINQCDIDIGRLGELMEDMGDGTAEGALAAGLAAALEALGLSPDDARCVADAAVADGASPTDVPEVDELEPYFDDCGVDAGDLGD